PQNLVVHGDFRLQQLERDETWIVARRFRKVDNSGPAPAQFPQQTKSLDVGKVGSHVSFSLATASADSAPDLRERRLFDGLGYRLAVELPSLSEKNDPGSVRVGCETMR